MIGNIKNYGGTLLEGYMAADTVPSGTKVIVDKCPKLVLDLSKQEEAIIEEIRKFKHGKLTVIVQDKCIIRIVKEESIKL